MASIRVEDKARTDPRFRVLGSKMGTSRFDARGRMEELWAHCTENQTYIIAPMLIDALAEFDGFSTLICDAEVGLGEFSDGGIRIRGTKGRIEWLKKLRKNAKKGGKARAAKASQKPATRLEKGSHKASQNEAKANPEPSVLTLAPVLAPSPVLAQKKEEERKEGTAPAIAGRPPSNIQIFIQHYVAAFQLRFPEARPELGGKVQGQIKHFLKDRPLRRAINLIEVYFQMEDPWFEKKAFDFSTFTENIQKVSIALDTGELPGRTNWKAIFGENYNAST